MIVKARKFDMRQWVLVTNWNPLEIWLYSEPYIRFPASDFDPDNITNNYGHLSNHSVAKNGVDTNNKFQIENNMWCLQEFMDYLNEEYGYDVWEERISEGIKNIVIHSLESAQDMFEQ